MLKRVVVISFVLTILGIRVTQGQSSDPRIIITVRGDLVSINTQGEDQKTLLSNGCWNRALRLLADGLTLVFSSADWEDCAVRGINRLDLSRGRVTHLSSISAPGIVSPDGAMLTQLRLPSGGVQQASFGPHTITVWDLTTGRTRKVLENIYGHFSVIDMVWSPDSRYLAYHAVNNENPVKEWEWAIIDLITDTTITSSDRMPPRWSPGGILLENPPTNFPSTDSGMEMITWSPDGRHFAYTSQTSYNEALSLIMSAIWIADSKTGEARQVHPNTENGLSPIWAPDGTILAYTQTAYDIAFDPNIGESGANRPVNFRHVLHLVEGDENTAIFEMECPEIWCELHPVWLAS